MINFSVIIPVYNVAPYLRACLDSVLVASRQLRAEWSLEVICVDDGSTDESGKILDEYANRIGTQRAIESSHLLFRVIHQGNQGVSRARNAALNLCGGDWIVFVDADDLIHPKMLVRCVAAILQNQEAVLLHFQACRFEGHGLFESASYGEMRKYDLRKIIPYQFAESDFFQFVYNRKLIHDLRFPLYVMGEDRLFLAWVLVRADSVVALPFQLYWYRHRPGSATGGTWSRRKKIDDLKHIVRRLIAFAFSRKHVQFRVYRHQIGLMIRKFV